MKTQKPILTLCFCNRPGKHSTILSVLPSATRVHELSTEVLKYWSTEFEHNRASRRNVVEFFELGISLRKYGLGSHRKTSTEGTPTRTYIPCADDWSSQTQPKMLKCTELFILRVINKDILNKNGDSFFFSLFPAESHWSLY